MKKQIFHLTDCQKPKDVFVLPEFSVENATLSLTMKVRRNKRMNKYNEKRQSFLHE